jgi:predicted ATP-grasp superfamily ATP-dependent carboligase
MEKTPAVVTPLDEHMGLDIARSLGKRGIPVYGFDWDPQVVGAKSKYCQLVLCPDPKESEEAYIEFVLDWGRKLGQKAVLYPVSDDMVVLWSRERQRLQQFYEYVMPDHDLLMSLLTKEGLVAAAKDHGVPTPETIAPKDAAEVESLAPSLNYPVILKPIESAYWHGPEISSMLRQTLLSGRAKVKQCDNPDELLQWYRDIAQFDDRMIIQEVVTGPVTNGGYITFYLDRQSNPLGVFAGHKMRVLPLGYGSSCYVHSFCDADLEEVALRLLSGVRYQGLGGLEFKKDPRDGLYKVIEFNTRYGMWDGLGIKCGVDNPYLAYCDALGLPVEPQRTYPEGIIWVDWQRDVRVFWLLRKQGKLTLRQWLQSLRGEKMWAVYSGDDWRPGLAFTVHLVQEFGRRVWRRIFKR